MEIKKFENIDVMLMTNYQKKYLEKDIKTLTPIQREIVLNIRVLNLKIRNDIKADDFTYSENEFKNYLINKGYNKEFTDSILWIILDSYNLMLQFLNSGKGSSKSRVLRETYIMTDSTGLYKIGKAIDPIKRLNQIKTGNISIKLIAYLKKDIEAHLHNKYKKYKYKREWFKFPDNVILDILKDYKFALYNRKD